MRITPATVSYIVHVLIKRTVATFADGDVSAVFEIRVAVDVHYVEHVMSSVPISHSLHQDAMVPAIGGRVRRILVR